MMAPAQNPLDGIRVIDLTRVLSGPFCTMLLGDMGAEIIKIEPPGKGDPIREQGGMRDGLSWYFAAFNRNKKSVELDLYSDDGKALLSRLIEGADVLVENFRPGVMARMGFSPEELERLKIPHKSMVVGDGPAKEELQQRLRKTIFTGHLSGRELSTDYP
jgi:CoA:oxalate CoA-transferase